MASPFHIRNVKPNNRDPMLGMTSDSQCCTAAGPYATLNIVSTELLFDKYCQLLENWMINDSLRLGEKRCSISRHFDNLISYK